MINLVPTCVKCGSPVTDLLEAEASVLTSRDDCELAFCTFDMAIPTILAP